MSLSSIPPAQLALIPAAKPPDGVIPNLVNPDSCGPAVVAALAVSSALMSVFVILRMYTKIKIVRSTDWADCKLSHNRPSTC